MLLADVVETSKRVAETTRRIEKIDVLAALLRRIEGEEIETVVAWLSGGTRQGRIGIGYAVLRDAAAPPALLARLEVADVDRALDDFAALEGRGSEGRKRELLHSLFARATEPEQRFLTGLLAGELRQGALEGIMLEALAKASCVSAERIRRAVMLAGEMAGVARAVLEHGAEGLAQYDVRLFRPVQPMLAQTAEDVAGALRDLGKAAFEFKFDGARVQVHRSGDDVVVFSRSLNNVTAAVPEIVQAVRALPAKDLIIDGEVLSLTPEGRPQPFQVTMRRFGRKLDVDRIRAELPLTPFWFDLLYLDGQSVIDEPQERRFSALREISPGQNLAPYLVTDNPDDAVSFLREALERGHEGLMAKAAGSAYAAGARGQSWLKIKPARALDLVVLAAEWGHGRRRGWLSNLHLGARDVEKGGFAMLGKTFKGLTDEMLAWQTERLLALELARDEYTVYVRPELVAEIVFNEIQVSPRYPSGLALRFARVKRYRQDKSAADSDTFQTVQKLAGMSS
ncbi:MAG: ATP-dependent DNA ligase [Acidobacteria bacterium]|nr:ATP-dependent DNA ligase [Acidobacteriota bacterium]MBI3279339.1 ATP-dependent DNA ligase [Acidobacteriota bacterium]